MNKSLELDGRQRQQLHAALLSAFPRVESLEQLVNWEFNTNLASISLGRNLTEVIFHLIEWAEAHSYVYRLVVATRRTNPDNARLRAFAEQVGIQIHLDQAVALPLAAL